MTEIVVSPRRNKRLIIGAVSLASAAVVAFGATFAFNLNNANAAQTVVVSSTAQLEDAVINAEAGDVISVKAGTYYPTQSLRSDGNGTASNPIKLQPYGNGAVKVDGSQLPDDKWIVAIYASYWQISDMTFTNGPRQGVVVTSSTGGVFKNLVTSHNGDSGFTLRGDNTNNNLVENLDSFRNYDAVNNGENADGIAIKYGNGTGNVIRDARLYENADDGLDLWAWETPIRIEGSWAFANGFNRWGDSNWQGDGNGFKLGGNDENVAHVVTKNAAWSNAGNGFTENSNQGAMTIHSNTAYANEKTGFWFQTGYARLARNLSVSNNPDVKTTSRNVEAANSWNDGVNVPSFKSTNGTEAYNARSANGTLPTVTFLTTGSTAIGAPMN